MLRGLTLGLLVLTTAACKRSIAERPLPIADAAPVRATALRFDVSKIDAAVCEDRTEWKPHDKCPLHGTMLVKGVIGGRLDQAAPDWAPEDLEGAKLFPEANDDYTFRCVPTEFPCVRTWFCPQCRKEKQAWLAARHGAPTR
jgi:hypothetical protein